MPSEPEHLQKAQHDEHLMKRLEEEFFDWVATAGFYAGLHYVDAMLARSGVHPGTHSNRNEHTRNLTRSAYRAYRTLKHVSERARYEANQMVGRNEIAAEVLPALRELKQELGFPLDDG